MLEPITAIDHIATARLDLLSWRTHHATALHQLLDENFEFLRPWIPFVGPHRKSLTDIGRLLERYHAQRSAGQAARYGLFPRGVAVPLGEVLVFNRGDRVECGYWLAKSSTGLGYAFEATTALVGEVFGRTSVGAIHLVCEAENQASNQLAKRLGAVVTERAHGPSVRDGSEVVIVTWTLLGP
ncbi:MAG: GNAT family protein [Myxococcota bacterium]